MNGCKLFKCDYWNQYICCHTCPKKDGRSSSRCHDVCLNCTEKCGAYIDEPVLFDASERMKERRRETNRKSRQAHPDKEVARKKEFYNTPRFKVGDRIIMKRANKFPDGHPNTKVYMVKAVNDDGTYKIITPGIIKDLKIGFVNTAFKLVEEVQK
jgi:hypothetical protein